MSLRRPVSTRSSNPLEVAEIFGQFRLKGFNSTGFPVGLFAENDGTLRQQLILHDGTNQQRARSETNGSLITSLYGKNSGTLTSINLEVTGEQRNVLLGHDGAALQRLKTETSRELAVSNYGKTSGGVATALRVDAAGFLRTREFEAWEGSPDVVIINTVVTTIYTVPASTTAVVEIEIANTAAVARSFDFHIIPSGGVAAVGNRMRTGTTVAAGAADRLGPYHVDAGVFFQARVASVGGVGGELNAIAIVREFGTGDSVTL